MSDPKAVRIDLPLSELVPQLRVPEGWTLVTSGVGWTLSKDGRLGMKLVSIWINYRHTVAWARRLDRVELAPGLPALYEGGHRVSKPRSRSIKIANLTLKKLQCALDGLVESVEEYMQRYDQHRVTAEAVEAAWQERVKALGPVPVEYAELTRYDDEELSVRFFLPDEDVRALFRWFHERRRGGD